ncbi:unnamed protein product [Alternaria alternata]
MGLAPLLVDTYRKYKKGTNNFVQWLAETARATGTVNDVFKDSRQDVVPPTGGRLKGAARKEAKKAGRTQNATATCQITTKSFLTLATAIAADKRTSVPPEVFTTLRAVIRGRKDCAVWYSMISDQVDDAAKESNAGHRHFIKLLEDVLGIIKPKLPQIQRQPLKAAKTAPLHTNNAYEHLESEESLETEDMPDVIESPVRPVTQKVSYKLEPSDTDVSFVIYCFLKDATHLRLAVRRTWREFVKGDIGLQAAALTMNAALAMIEKLSNEFEQAHPHFKDSGSQKMHLEIVQFIYSSYSESGKGPAFIDGGDEDSDPFAYKEGKQILRSDTVMCTHTTELVIGIFWLEKTKEKCRLTNDERRFLKCISQFVSTPDEEPMPDSYMVRKAAKNMLYDRNLNSWIVFSLQIFWDMQRELGSCLHLGKMLFDKTGQQLIERYKAYLNVEGLENVGATHVTFREDIVRRKKFIEILLNDTLVQEAFDQCEKQTSRTFDNIPGFSLLESAIDMASNQGQIIVSAHLYNAVQRFGEIPEGLQWADMDWLIERQGSDWMFMGKRPKQGSTFGKHVNLILGFSAHKFTAVYRSRNPEAETEYNVGGPRHKKPVGVSKAKNDILVMVECLVNDFQGKPDDTCKPLSSLEKLSIFKLAIERDESAFAFDVMDFNLRCIRLLQEIQKYALTFAPLDYPTSKFTGGLSMNNVIGDMLYDLGGNQRHHASIFPVAAVILRKVVQREGNNVLMSANVCQEEMKLDLEKFKAEDEPSFENPFEDAMDLEFRGMASHIILLDENGNSRMPFGPPV